MASSSGGSTDVLPHNVNVSSSKYKAYVQAVDRALKTFENPNEWADLISALGKLTKVFQSNAKFGDIPKPVLVAKRLSQCLHPALPMGVHLKALETYKQVFDILGSQLPRMLYLFACGLFPLMDHCGIKLFGLFDQYLVPLGPSLRPALPGFLAGVLLGLEEGTEFYERSLKVLDKVSEGVGFMWFYSCLWQAILGSPAVRLPAMLYVNNKFDRSRSFDDQIYVVGDHVNHMISALCSTAEDTGSSLIQRHLLDFIYAAFPFDSSNLTTVDFIQLLRRCLFVVLRRDMTLNRRLYVWLLTPGGGGGSAPTNVADDKEDTTFFTTTVLPLCVAALDEYLKIGLIDVPGTSLNDWAHGYADRKEGDMVQFSEVRVCRLLTYMLDRVNVGKPLLLKVLPLLLGRCAKLHADNCIPEIPVNANNETKDIDSNVRFQLTLNFNQEIKPEEEIDLTIQNRRLDEITKMLNVLLGAMDTGFLWEFLSQWFTSLLETEASANEIQEFSQVVLFSLKISSVEGDIRRNFLPVFLRQILIGCREHCTKLETSSITNILLVASKILGIVSEDGLVQLQETPSESDGASLSSPVKGITKPSSLQDQALIEECVKESFSLLAVASKAYADQRSYSNYMLFDGVCKLANLFADFPIFCTELQEVASKELPAWTTNLIEVISPANFVTMMDSNQIDLKDLTARINAIDFIISMYFRSASVLSQHEVMEKRRPLTEKQGLSETAIAVLLKPLLLRNHFALLEGSRLFERCGNAIWKGLSSFQCAHLHQQLSRLLALLHSRKGTDPSSDAESIIIAALTQNDPMMSANATRTFHRMWILLRSIEDQFSGMNLKAFNRTVMLLLGILADESISRTKSELKSLVAAWFIDCAKHNDLPKIVQMLCTLLMNPVTSRVSIQYLRKESKLTREQVPNLPPGASVTTLVAVDGKQRLYHLDGDVESGTISELRNKLLLNSDAPQNSIEEPLASIMSCASGDVPNFDEDTDSLDTLSITMEGVDPAVIETVQYLIDCVVEEEESEMELRYRLQKAVELAPPMGQTVLLGETGGTSMTGATSNTSVFEDESKDKLDSVGRIKKGHRRQDSLQETIYGMTERDLKAFDAADLLRSSVDSEGETLFHELHTHILLYGESGRVVDLGRAETAFRILTSLLNPRAAPISNRMLLSCLVSSGTAAQASETSLGLAGSLVDLMARHVRAILGQHFWAECEEETKHRHFTLLELLITISLHFLRSFFLNSPISVVSENDIATSWKCKIAALDFLSELFSELSVMISEQQSRAFALFVQSILVRSKLQKCILHLLLSSVQETEPAQRNKISVSICDFNEGANNMVGRRLSGLLSAYQRSLLSLTAQHIRLEHEIRTGLASFNDQNASGIMLNRLAINQQLYNPSRGTIRDVHSALVELRAFLIMVLAAFKRKPHNHEMWMQFIVQILPWLGRGLATLVVRVVEQLCKNVEVAMKLAFDLSGSGSLTDDTYPAGFITMTLETITTLIHYCVVDTCATNSSTIQNVPSVPHNTGQSTSMVGQAMSAIPGSKGATELFTNLVKVFSFSESSSANAVALSKLEAAKNTNAGWKQAKNDMLTSLPHALATICDVWSVVCSDTQVKLPLTTPQQLRRHVLDLLSPIAQHHQQAFLQALSLVWLTRSAEGNGSPRKIDNDQSSFAYTQQQLHISTLLLSLKVIPFEELVSAVSETLKEAGAKVTKLGITADKVIQSVFPTEAPLLELVHGCIKALPATQLRQCWPSIHALLNDVPLGSLPPRAIFLLFIILCDYVRIAGATYIVEDRNMSRGVQDSVQKLTEAVNAIVGWQLETTTWLKRTLVVKQDQHTGIRSQDVTPSSESLPPLGTSLGGSSEQSSMRGSTPSLANKPLPSEITSVSSLPDKKSNSNLRGSVKDPNNNKRDPAHSTQALFLLSENLTELIDAVCKSDDKERLLPTLHAVWNNVVPYLKAKNARNARFFLASSRLLALMSSYSYMRPVWKKTTLELLLDSYFFKMDVQSLKQWLIVTDHLMTHDKTSFKDLLKSIAYSPNASFSIMTSKEQEYEARAQALKRLAFVVLGSELDQYQPQINDIQERLTENLRVSQSPSIRSAVFLCIRVLLVRLRPGSLVGIWPIMVTELVDVLLQMEQQLSGEQNEEAGGKDDAWMQLYLAACKLLESLCTLPAGYLPQFQMCHWAFVNSVSHDRSYAFNPFAGRINELLKSKYGTLSEEDSYTQCASLGNIKLLTSFDELRSFFNSLATLNETVPEISGVTKLSASDMLSGASSYKNAITRLENALYVDFAEHWQL